MPEEAGEAATIMQPLVQVEPVAVEMGARHQMQQVLRVAPIPAEAAVAEETTLLRLAAAQAAPALSSSS